MIPQISIHRPTYRISWISFFLSIYPHNFIIHLLFLPSILAINIPFYFCHSYHHIILTK